MNINQVETFYWIVRSGGFTAAAARLHTTQSTVSMRIRELERTLGVELFERGQRGARVTAAGRELMMYAEQMLRISAQIRERVATADTVPGRLRLGVAEVISITWLPRLVQEIHRRFPKIALELDEALTQDLVDRLRDGSLDLVLAPGRVAGTGFSLVPLGNVRFAWMASPKLKLPQRALTARVLQEYPVITLSRQSYHHTTIEDWFLASGANCRRIDTCKSVALAAALAVAGVGVTLLPVRCYQTEVATRRLRVIRTVPPMPPVEFTAARLTDTIQPVVRAVSLIAAEISDFDHAGGRSVGEREL
jgi:DNA-binding transcriptional LysR family regulator